jgi:hypothetical protein
MLMLAKKLFFIPVVFFLVMVVGCATPVRDAVKIDTSLPIGKIEGNQFTGIRYPFNVSAPPNWRVSMTYPSFMLDLGYEKPGLEESQVFVYNPASQSNLQIDFEVADRYSHFSQASIEALTASIGGKRCVRHKGTSRNRGYCPGANRARFSEGRSVCREEICDF